MRVTLYLADKGNNALQSTLNSSQLQMQREGKLLQLQRRIRALSTQVQVIVDEGCHLLWQDYRKTYLQGMALSKL
jgi:hypothetical protein